MRGGVGPAAPRSWGRTKGGDPAAFIGTLIKGAQARPQRNDQESHKSFDYLAISALTRPTPGPKRRHADRTSRARHPAEHRYDPAARGLSRGRGPHHRADRLSEF